MSMGPLRRVRQVERYRSKYAPFGCYSVILYLECGHEEARKASDYKGGRVRCEQCARGSR